MASRSIAEGTPLERFWQKVKKTTDGCWLWGGHAFTNGYGCHYVKQRGVLAHRYAFEAFKGEIPSGMQVDHTCHQRSCVNPDHLRLASNKQNMENPSGVRRDNRHGYRGVGFNKRTGKYRARVQHNGKEYYAGEFDTPEEAAEAARQLRLSLFTHNTADRQLGEAPIVQFTTPEMRRRSRPRTVTCAGSCGRELRNHKVPREEAPHLISIKARGLCSFCYHAERKK